MFGPTIQGEGPSAGRPAVFVRLGACNLACAWCDTAYTWDGDRYDLSRELQIRSTGDVAREVLALRPSLVVLTGGEPALQSREAARLARAITDGGSAIELETSGTVPLGALANAVRLVVTSPKLSSSAVLDRARLRWGVLAEIAALPHAVFKFVVQSPTDLREADEIVARLGLSPGRVWLMPEATHAAALADGLRALAPHAVSRGWSLSSRLQVAVWGDERGR
ncbi:7-carboxy-7-deazaguanine synthase QueE [uncultured Modestobacter sp.]|uniref:7-carboxy-7-deazaguanine synthase QueE n=1 Tax=uncultured Modestobacter sp. TaxID=380048 RepID=UPI002611A992|nr:7-carboxy-7-deazaguanine synthase QueE [uncultured Modestobacter sp.]